MSKAAELAALIGSQTALSNRNLIINGAMQVAQRGTSTTGVTGQGYHAVDRFDQNITTMGAYTISQSTTAPTDFTTSLKMDVTTADASPASGDVVAIRTKLEGLNLQQLNFGSSDAKSITLSFYVKSNKTGTYVVSSYLADAGKQWGQTYTIASANTWERKTITWQGSSNSSVINNDSGAGLIFTWYLGAGTGRTSGTAQTDWTAYATTGEAVGQTVNIADSTANEFFITGVQLEVGEQATPFEHRSFGDELARCQRYYYYSGFGFNNPGGTDSGSTDYEGQIFSVHIGSNRHTFFGSFPVFLRGLPTLTFYSPHDGASANAENYTGGGNISISASYARSRQGLGGYSQTSTSGDTLRAYVEANAEL